MTLVYEDARVTIDLFGPLGSFGNNSYVLRAKSGGPAVIIDAPEGVEEVVHALAGEAVSAIVITHQHRDHWDGLATLRASVDAPVYVGPEPQRLDIASDAQELREGASLVVGDVAVEVLETPGHTPGSICLYLRAGAAGGAVLTGDTLFPGGPGRTGSRGALDEEIASIVSKLYALPGAVIVLPGHGDGTSVAASKAEYEVFAKREHPADLAGDVLWLES